MKHVQAAGQQLAVYRGRNDEKVYVLDAYCPHMGANLAVGGTVKGDCLECPFHQWQFNGNRALVCASVCVLLPHRSVMCSMPESLAFARVSDTGSELPCARRCFLRRRHCEHDPVLGQ